MNKKYNFEIDKKFLNYYDGKMQQVFLLFNR